MKKTILSVLLVGIALVIIIPIFKIGSFTDESDYILGGCLIAKGQVIYRDFFSHHFPMPYYFLAMFFKIFGCKIFLARYLMTTLYFLSVVFVYKIAKNIYLFISLIIFFLIANDYRGIFYLSESLVNIGLIFVSLNLFYRNKCSKLINVFSLSVGYIFLLNSNQTGLIFLVIIFIYLLIVERDKCPNILAVLSASCFFLAPLIVSQNFIQFWDNVILYNTNIYAKFVGNDLMNPVNWLLNFGSYIFSRSWLSFGGINLFETFLFFGLLTGFAAIKNKTHKILIFILIVVSFNRYTGIFKDDAFRMINFFMIALLTLSAAKFKNVKFALIKPVIFLLLFMIGISRYPINLLNKQKYSHDYWYWQFFDPDVRQYTKEGDSVLFYPAYPSSYLTNNRTPGSYYYFFLPWQAGISGIEERIISDIEKNKVKLIVFNNDFVLIKGQSIQKYAPKVYGYLLTNYKIVDGLPRDKARIFLRNL